ncbi:hypothetical protein D3C83_21280 [compost metagenome]
MAKLVSWPWPCECDTEYTVTEPSAATSIATVSFGNSPAPVFSITVEMPMPRSFPACSERRRRAVKPLQSESLSAFSSSPGRSALS